MLEVEQRLHTNRPRWQYWLLAVMLIASSGVTYRFLASRVEYAVAKPVKLPVGLDDFPTRISQWVGSDLPIPPATRTYVQENFADDYLSRRYINTTSNIWADLYVVYCSSRPGSIVGHRPRQCYPGAGWVHDGTEVSSFVSRAGRRIPCLVHRFHRPVSPYEEVVVLNYYLLNGRITNDEDRFSGPFGRRPNIAGDPARYVAQIQISSISATAVKSAARDISDRILDFLPGEDGRVRAATGNRLVDAGLN